MRRRSSGHPGPGRSEGRPGSRLSYVAEDRYPSAEVYGCRPVTVSVVWRGGAEERLLPRRPHNLASAKTQADFTILQGSIAANEDVPVSNYTDSLHRQASQALKTLRVVPSSVHGALAPLSFLDDWLDILTVFVYSPTWTAVHQTVVLMKSADVAGNSAWYWSR